MIQKVMNALEKKDYRALAACFTKDCRYFDYCPSCNGEDNYFVYGSDCVEMFFRNRFVFEHLVVSDPVIEDEKTASFFGAYDGPYVYAKLRIEETAENGLIKKVVVHPS